MCGMFLFDTDIVKRQLGEATGDTQKKQWDAEDEWRLSFFLLNLLRMFNF